jgi:arsenical-resistance protein 2
MAEATPNTAEPAEAPWHAAFPAPQIAARSVSREEVLQWLQEGKTDFLLVDVRRMDCEVRFPLSFYCFSPSSHTKMPFLAQVFWLYEMELLNISIKGGLIRGSINLPAQPLYYTVPALYNLFSAAKKTKIIWYCGKYITFYFPSRVNWDSKL